MLTVKIPFMPKAEQAQPLKQCIENAARRHGIEADEMVMAMTYFLEEIVEGVSRGEIVRIPGFGAFGAITHELKGKHNKERPPIIRPRFYPAGGFNMKVATGPAKMSNKQKLDGYGRRHHVGNVEKAGKKTTRTAKTMKDWRDTMRKNSPIMRACLAHI